MFKFIITPNKLNSSSFAATSTSNLFIHALEGVQNRLWKYAGLRPTDYSYTFGPFDPNAPYPK